MGRWLAPRLWTGDAVGEADGASVADGRSVAGAADDAVAGRRAGSDRSDARRSGPAVATPVQERPVSLEIAIRAVGEQNVACREAKAVGAARPADRAGDAVADRGGAKGDRKSTRLNS